MKKITLFFIGMCLFSVVFVTGGLYSIYSNEKNASRDAFNSRNSPGTHSKITLTTTTTYVIPVKNRGISTPSH